ncbi:right-handed parallel beta-helix repeat-containing protein (plasmid) [Halobaculum sp. CBA1158]|uniref:right-handed parallel beta-helix repeat-containing protein n=1 Tax=Halobaculum sp. CBA1158 TaxID=2904243 RepID=UPI001F386768|nr:right-handed parallel beta-helix repeat-containing protein [Halobaculum sp. CBA1158]UIP01522.1 right-handed parallel beta-helix repeat-containing protein [Halobaculum sp. CBA1158]
MLRRLAAVTAAAALAGCGGRGNDPSTTTGRETDTSTVTTTPGSTSPTTPEEVASRWGFERTVDLVEAGADPTGEEPIDEAFDAAVAPDTLVYLPSGTYRVADGITVGGLDRIGLLGSDATVVPREGNEDNLFSFGWPEPVREALFKGITFDFSAPDTGGRPLLAQASDSLLVEGLVVKGEADVNQDLVRVDVTDSDGSGVVRGLRLLDGAIPDYRITGCEVGDDNRGDVSFVDCRIDGFPDNGLYANPPEGSVSVLGGRYRNNGVAGVRVEVADDAVVRGVHVRCDDAEGAGENMRGIRLRAGNSVLVEDCLVELLEVTSSDGAVTFASELGAATVRNCHLRVDADGVNAVRIKRAADRQVREGPFRCESLTIVGSAETGAAIQAADRSGCSFRDLCVFQPGEDRDGFDTDNVHGEVADSRLAVTGRPFRLENSTLDRSNVTVSPDADEAAAGDEGDGDAARFGPCADSDRGSDVDPDGADDA